MMYNLLDRLGDWNPQFLRELKGRLQSRNLLTVIAISLLSQFLLFISFQTQLPVSREPGDPIVSNSNKYCTGSLIYGLPECLQDGFGNTIIDWHLWWLDLFTWLSLIGCFTLLVAGTYLIISDLATEERRDTLNFIRLSPQPHQNILWGKILGVPILLYLGIALAIPLHFWSGLAANIPLGRILSFDVVVLTACFFYYSGSLLFSVVGSWLGGFQAWLGSGLVLGFLILTKQWLIDISSDYPWLVLNFFNPFFFIPNLSFSSSFSNVTWEKFHWFALPLGTSFFAIIGIALLNYSILTRFIWLALQRCFRNPNATMFSKQQSYLFMSYFAVLMLGYANWQKLVGGRFSYPTYLMKENLAILLFLHMWLFLYLIAAITPHRQTIQDWARYRRIPQNQKLRNSSLFQDLIWGEKSPALVAIALNAIIAIASLSLLVFLTEDNVKDKIDAVYALALSGSLAMIYAALTQLILFMKSQQRIFWAVGILSAVIVLPVIVLGILLHNPANSTFLWLFSVAAPLVALYPSGNSLSSITVFFAIIAQGIIFGLLVFQLRRQLKKAGESATKAMLLEKVRS